MIAFGFDAFDLLLDLLNFAFKFVVHDGIITAFAGGATGSDECVKVNVTQTGIVKISIYTIACGNPCFSCDVFAQDASGCIAMIIDAEALIQVSPIDVVHDDIITAFSGGATGSECYSESLRMLTNASMPM